MRANYFLYSLVYTTILISICLVFNINFFNIDDALNEMLGFYRQYGEIWSSGNIPFIVDSMFVGGNGVVDLGKSIFVPQGIIGSLIAYYNDFHYTGVFLAFFNFFLIAYSSIYIAKCFSIRGIYKYAFASFVCLQPVFLYQYSAGWWNAANGQTWATVSIATFLLLTHKVTIIRVILNFLSVVFMLSAGWPHGVIGYGVVIVAYFILNYKSTNFRDLLLCYIPTILAFLASIPIYSEYINSSDVVNRANGYHNNGKFMGVEWSTILMGFSPTHYNYTHYFGGYRLITVPLAFSTVFLLPVFFYKNILDIIKKNRSDFLSISLLIVFYFVLTQMPSQFGPLRWPFRFLPFLSLAICLLVFYLLSKLGDTKEKSNFNYKGYYLTILVLSIISIFTSFNFENSVKYILLQLLSALFLCIIPAFVFYVNNIVKVIIPAAMSLIIMLLGSNSLGGKYVAYFDLKEKIDIPKAINLNGFYISFTGDGFLGGYHNKNSINDINSSQFGLYDIRSIGGYSPVGNSKLDALLPHPSAHAHFKIEGLKNILKNSEFGVCVSSLMRVSTIAVSKNDYSNLKSQLDFCGYTDVNTASNNDLFISLPKEKTLGWNEYIPSSFPSISINVITHTNNSDILEVGERNSVTTLVFPRVYWKGYSATLNGEPVKVSYDNTGVLVKVELPQGNKGTLELSYFPKTWKVLWFLPLLAILSMFVFLFYIRRIK